MSRNRSVPELFPRSLAGVVPLALLGALALSVRAAPSPSPEARLRAAREKLALLGAEYPFEPRFLENDGVWQHYLDEGPRDGEALLFLHGNPTWSFLWRRLIGALRDRRRCVAPDHVGCGLSDKPADYEYVLRNHIGGVERLVEHLGLERITLVMHDWGGVIGMGFARRHPELVSRLVILNTAAFHDGRIPRRILLCRTPILGAIAVRDLNVFVRLATTMAVAKPMPPEVKRGFLLPYDGWANRVAIHRFVQDIPLAPSHRSYAELTAIDDSLDEFRDRPAILLWGERDWCFTPRFREVWQRRLPHAEVYRFDDASHYVTEDAAGEVFVALEGFLEKHPLP